MKRIICLALLLTFFAAAATPQESEVPKKKVVSSKFFYFGAGIGIGFFYPKEVNDLLIERYDEYLSVGFTDMIMYFDILVSGSFFFNRYCELLVDMEVVTAPKFVVRGDNTDSYLLSRITPGIKFNCHIPLGQRLSYYIGAGGSYSFITFTGTEIETTVAGTPGIAFQNGVMVRFKKFAIEPFLGYNYIFSKTDYSGTGSVGTDFSDNGRVSELSYSGVQLGCKIMF